MYGNPYYNSMLKYQSNGNQMTQPQYMSNIQQPIQPIQTINNQMGILGKIVDSIDVVKAMDIPLDGSISYFPLTDGSAIVTKRLQNDGTSKTIVYKPIEETEDKVKYMTFEDFEKAIGEININDFDGLRELKNDIKKIKDEIFEIKNKKK